MPAEHTREREAIWEHLQRYLDVFGGGGHVKSEDSQSALVRRPQSTQEANGWFYWLSDHVLSWQTERTTRML